MAVAVPFIMLAISAAGAVMAYKGQQEATAAREDAARYNAQMAERNAVIARDQAARDAETQGRAARGRIGAMRAAYGASGITLEGSALDMLEESASNAEMDKQNILYRGELRAMGFDSDAMLDRFSGQTAHTQGQYSSASALLSGAGSVVGAYGNMNTSAGGAVGGAGSSMGG